ncbi:GpE family phage tail protein [Serratia fonticola]
MKINSVEDAIADIATIFHWPPSELWPMSLVDLAEWRERAALRSGNTEEE